MYASLVRLCHEVAVARRAFAGKEDRPLALLARSPRKDDLRVRVGQDVRVGEDDLVTTTEETDEIRHLDPHVLVLSVYRMVQVVVSTLVWSKITLVVGTSQSSAHKTVVGIAVNEVLDAQLQRHNDGVGSYLWCHLPLKSATSRDQRPKTLHVNETL